MAYIHQGLAESKKGDAGGVPANSERISPEFARELLERSGSLNISAECLARVRDILGRIANGQTVSEAETDFVARVESNPNCAKTMTEAGMAWWVWAALAGAALFVVMGGNNKK